MTTVNDVVLIYIEDTPVSFARVETIRPDLKKDWYDITLLMLQIPVQTVTWILKDDYINGQEFHMNGKKMKLEKVEHPVDTAPDSSRSGSGDQDDLKKEAPPEKNQATIISFSDLKKKHDPTAG
ncbi:hypothetical protein [Desulfobacula sp.]|uniref:hypothetical protein n=1 Tax=Desulfobacula sp. TaxID=2593537 RepID=UPI00260A20DD|nr:hypothetical protein [Desulfobacula sp.]